MTTDAPSQAFVMEPAQQIPSPEAPVQWSLGLRWLFRFGFAYFILASLDAISTLQVLIRYFVTHRLGGGFIDPLWNRLMPWTLRHVLHLSPSIVFSNGRGDTTHDGLLLGFYLVFAAVAAVVWSLLDRKRLNYCKLHVWLRMIVRFVLASMMIVYGMDKVFPLQFGTLSLSRLTETVGNLSPQDMLWMFMAASISYTVFGGLVEVVGGLLLLVQPLTSLGALVCLGAMTNVFMLNVAYNVSVKLGSFQYLAMAAFLLVPEISRLSNAFLFNRTAQPVLYPPVFRDKRLNRAVLMIPTVLGLSVFVLFFVTSLNMYRARLKMMAAKPPLYGIWTVDAFAVSGNPQTTLFTGDARWHRLIFQNPNQLIVQPTEGDWYGVVLKMDAKDKTFTLKERGHAGWKAEFKFETPQPNLIDLQGSIDGKPVEVKLHRIDEAQYPLVSMGFH